MGFHLATHDSVVSYTAVGTMHRKQSTPYFFGQTCFHSMNRGFLCFGWTQTETSREPICWALPSTLNFSTEGNTFSSHITPNWHQILPDFCRQYSPWSQALLTCSTCTSHLNKMGNIKMWTLKFIMSEGTGDKQGYSFTHSTEKHMCSTHICIAAVSTAYAFCWNFSGLRNARITI